MNLSINTWDYDYITYQPTGWMISSVADHTFNGFYLIHVYMSISCNLQALFSKVPYSQGQLFFFLKDSQGQLHVSLKSVCNN